MDSVDIKVMVANESPFTKEDLEKFKNDGDTMKWPKTPFPIDSDINSKVLLYDGDISLLKADAVVNPTNENLTQLSFVNKLCGPELEIYLKKKVRLCATGDVRVTPGFKSNFKYIIHAVPPKYQPKYKTAAETALFHTYFRVLETMIEKKLRTVVMPTLTTTKCNLPFEDNCHLQLRIIRRILEKKRTEFEKIVLIVDNCDQYTIPFFCYFPRTSIDEEMALYKLTDSIGGSNGEPFIPGREIRIKSKPGVNSDIEKSIDLTSGLDLSVVVGKTAFSKMQDDLERQQSPLKKSDLTLTSSSKQLVIRRNILRSCTLL